MKVVRYSVIVILAGTPQGFPLFNVEGLECLSLPIGSQSGYAREGRATLRLNIPQRSKQAKAERRQHHYWYLLISLMLSHSSNVSTDVLWQLASGSMDDNHELPLWTRAFL